MNYIQQTIDFVKKELKGAEAGHDWFHIERVYKNTLHLLKTEQADEQVVLLGALLHDIADSKFHEGDETIGPKKAYDFMTTIEIPEDVKKHVVQIIENISFKGGNFEKDFRSKELEIVQDADRLDAIGAIGIARTFYYGGHRGNALYDDTKPRTIKQLTEENYRTESSVLNHFYEKLLLLEETMNTEAGKEEARVRTQFMQTFLDRFFEEISDS